MGILILQMIKSAAFFPTFNFLYAFSSILQFSCQLTHSLFELYISVSLAHFPIPLFPCDCALSTSLLFFSICIFHTLALSPSLSLSSPLLFIYPLTPRPFIIS